LNLRGGALSPFILNVVMANVRRVTNAGFVPVVSEPKRAHPVHARIFGETNAPARVRIDLYAVILSVVSMPCEREASIASAKVQNPSKCRSKPPHKPPE
jgi:hypothetical protein